MRELFTDISQQLYLRLVMDFAEASNGFHVYSKHPGLFIILFDQPCFTRVAEPVFHFNFMKGFFII